MTDIDSFAISGSSQSSVLHPDPHARAFSESHLLPPQLRVQAQVLPIRTVDAMTSLKARVSVAAPVTRFAGRCDLTPLFINHNLPPREVLRFLQRCLLDRASTVTVG